MKRIIFILLFVVSASMGDVFAEIIECVKIDYLYYDLNTETGCATVRDKETGIHSCSYSEPHITIPEEVEYDNQKYIVTAIAPYTFYRRGAYSGLPRSYTLPKTLREIGEGAFYDTYEFYSIVIPEGVTTISDYAFYGCELLRDIKLPNSITSIGTKAFYACNIPDDFVFPRNLKTIGYGAFDEASPRRIVLPYGVETIGASAFDDSNHDKTVIIPRTVKSIGEKAFFGMNRSTSFYVQWDTPIDLSGSIVCNDNSYYTSVRVPCGTKELYAAADYWKNYGIYERCIDNSTLYNIEATAVNGTITGTGQYPYGSYVTLTAVPAEGYRFSQWSDGVVCNPRTEAVTADATYTAEFSPFTQKQFSKTFSISDTSKVIFSSGNLQYLASENVWCFAENQYDIIGQANENISSTYEGWIDLFGWGTSGYHNDTDEYNTQYYPYSTSTSEVNIDKNKYGYGPSLNQTNKSLTKNSANYDWGVYNSILNGGNEPNQWRTLTQNQWLYIFNTRTNAANKWFRATVNNVKGVVLLPDEYTENTIPYIAGVVGFTTNTFSLEEWTVMENEGAVFLPAAGSRSGTTYTPGNVTYHSTTAKDSARNYILHVLEGNTSYNYIGPRYVGRAVRLVKDVRSNFTISVSGENGTVSGGGTYAFGTTLKIQATPNPCYRFIQWSDGNTDNPRTIVVNEDATYTAEFMPIPYTITVESADESQGTVQVEIN